jgi:hypothetical protein
MKLFKVLQSPRRTAGAFGLLLSLVIGVILALPITAMAVPQMPCQVYGDVVVNGAAAPAGVTIEASIGGVHYASSVTNATGKYGYAPSILRVPADDPSTPEKEGGAVGDTIELSISGTSVGTASFLPGVTTNIDLDFTGEVTLATQPANDNTSIADNTSTADTNSTTETSSTNDTSLNTDATSAVDTSSTTNNESTIVVASATSQAAPAPPVDALQPSSTVAVPASKPSAKTSTSAKFGVSDLKISPAEAQVGDKVTVEAVVKNSGAVKGQYDANLKIGNDIVDTMSLSLGPGNSRIVSFEITKASPGQYIVDLGGQQDVVSFTAKSFFKSDNLWIAVGVGIVLFILLIVTIAIIRRRSQYV